eukprot:6472707-Amphidinium_carterae.1
MTSLWPDSNSGGSQNQATTSTGQSHDLFCCFSCAYFWWGEAQCDEAKTGALNCNYASLSCLLIELIYLTCVVVFIVSPALRWACDSRCDAVCDCHPISQFLGDAQYV